MPRCTHKGMSRYISKDKRHSRTSFEVMYMREMGSVGQFTISYNTNMHLDCCVFIKRNKMWIFKNIVGKKGDLILKIKTRTKSRI